MCSRVLWLECRISKGDEGGRGSQGPVYEVLEASRSLWVMILSVTRSHWSVLSRGLTCSAFIFKITFWHLDCDLTVDAREEAGRAIGTEMMVTWVRMAPVELSAAESG